MSVVTIPVSPRVPSVESPAAPVSKYFSSLLKITDPNVTSAVGVGIAVSLLGALWAFQMYSTWATWGNLSIDCGREAYVPAMLAQGKTLYRDVWYLYGPAA